MKNLGLLWSCTSDSFVMIVDITSGLKLVAMRVMLLHMESVLTLVKR